ncbi:hypothetical protein BT69DRAFT_121589 [Atractiella rhizophila]|nr:hypothetical protein BT69DRAFT_121589 [Atractiella rhizophila]
MSAQQLPQPLPTAATRDTVGGFLIGVIVSIIICGSDFHQTSVYFRRYPEDTWKVKGVVGAVAFLLVLHVIFVTHNAYIWLVTNFGNLKAFNIVPFSYGCNFAILGLIAAFVQSWYASRIYAIGGRKKVFPIVIAFLAVYQCGWSFVGFIKGGLIVKEQSRFHEFRYGAINWLLAAALNDLLIAVGMTFHLLRTRKGFTGTTSIIYEIIRLTIENNALTAVIALIDLILFLTIQNGWNIALNLVLPPLYANSLLTLLHARDRFRETASGSRNTSRSRNTGMEMENKLPPTPGSITTTMPSRSPSSQQNQMQYHLNTSQRSVDFSQGPTRVYAEAKQGGYPTYHQEKSYVVDFQS